MCCVLHVLEEQVPLSRLYLPYRTWMWCTISYGPWNPYPHSASHNSEPYARVCATPSMMPMMSYTGMYDSLLGL